MRSTVFALVSCSMLALALGCADGAPTGPQALEESSTPALSLTDVAGTGTATSLYSLVAPNRCMDVEGASREAGARVLAWYCNGQPNQTWQWRADGEIRVYGSLCLDASGARGQNGDPIVIWWCNGGANQRWRATAAGEIRGINDRCITVVNSSTTPGARLELRDCTGQVGQRWNDRAAGSEPVPVATVTVSSPKSTLAPGETAQLSVLLHDASGNPLSGRAVTWSTGNPQAVTVSTSGLVTAVGVGTSLLTATSEGRTGGTIISVSAPPPPPPSDGSTIFTDGFESGSLSQWQDGVNTSIHRVITDAARAHSGSRMLEVTYPAGGEGGWLTRFFMPGHDSVRVSAWVLFPSDWTGDTRFLRLGGSRIDNQWSGVGAASRCPSGTDFFNSAVLFDYRNGQLDPMRFYTYHVGMARERDGVTCWGRWDAGANTTYNAPLTVSKNQWHRVDFWIRLNTPGQSNGIQRFWLDGELKGEWRNLNFRSTTDLRLNWLQLTFRSEQSSSVARRLYIDDIVVQANASGGASAPAPAPAPTPDPQPAPVASVTLNPSSATLAVGGVAQLSATTRDALGNILTGRMVSWTSSNPAIATVTAAGLVTGLLGGSATITATSEGRSASAAVTVNAPAPTVPAPGTTPSITSLSRDAGSTTGGTTLLVNGSNLSAGTEVLFDGQRASSVTAISATQLRVQTPARAGAGPVAVIVRNGTSADTLANAFEYVPAPTKTFVSHGFEDGSRGRFGFWQTTVTTEAARSGTRSAKSVINGTEQSADLTFLYGNNPAVVEPNGVFQRWYLMMPQSTIDATRSGQVKLHLSRYNEETGGGGAWLMMGIGAEFGSRQAGQLTAFADYGILVLPGTYTPVVLQPGQWYEIQVWYRRVAGRGYVKLWVNGKRYMETSHTALGSDRATDLMSYRIGAVFTQHNSGPVTTFVDDAASANGFIEP